MPHLLRPSLFSLAAMCLASTSFADAPRPQAEPFPLDQIRLEDGIFKQRQDTHLRYLKMVEPDRLLSAFLTRAGLEAKGERYGGWEARDITGHSLGHYLSALSLMYAATGDAELKQRIDYIVQELAAVQEANGDGYVMTVDKSAFEEIRAGKVRASPFNLNGVWVPFYTMHKVFAGLRDAYRYTGSEQALEVEKGMAEWVDSVFSPLTPEQVQEVLRTEHGGMNEVLADLSVDTGDERYLRMAIDYFNHRAVLDPMYEGRDALNGLHGNTQIPKVIGVAREYELTGEERFHTAATSFWDHVVNDRSYVIGGHGEGEHFFPVEEFPNKLTPYTCETCNTYNLHKLTGHLFAWSPDAAEMDFVERSQLNHILANTGHEEGEFGYFLTMESVGVKVFSSEFDSWWCCVGTGLENPARYAEQAYFHSPDGDTLWVNLFLGSRLDWPEKGLKLTQETDFPDDDTTRLIIDAEQPVRLALKLRQPYWCEKPEVKVNGKRVKVDGKPSSYLTLEREWKDGDVVELRLAMSLHSEPLPHSKGEIVSVLYGPSVLAAIVPEEPGIDNPGGERFSDHLAARGKTDAFAPLFVAPSVQKVLAGLKPTRKGFAEFRSKGVVQPQDLTFVPLYRIYDEQYAVYFPLLTQAQWKEREQEIRADRARQQQFEQATVDFIDCGYQQPEVEHELQEQSSRIEEVAGGKGRVADKGGHFSYQVAVDPQEPITLVATYWGSQWQRRTFDIYLDDELLQEATVGPETPGRFYEQQYAVPAELTRGKDHVRVRFQARSDGMAGTLFGLRAMRTGDMPAARE
ncbi:MAG: glycoside hydrolase family 127 protein [Verrucomicrobiota bacterium JB022]|nr:glycoside hydrolase family 127 protein [Verrucomicrobiota bacterium JB022]